jgi:hypothetical protein
MTALKFLSFCTCYTYWLEIELAKCALLCDALANGSHPRLLLSQNPAQKMRMNLRDQFLAMLDRFQFLKVWISVRYQYQLGIGIVCLKRLTVTYFIHNTLLQDSMALMEQSQARLVVWRRSFDTWISVRFIFLLQFTKMKMLVD